MDLNQSKFSSAGIAIQELLEQSYYRFLYRGKDQASGQPLLINHWPTALIKTIEGQGQFSQDIFRFQGLAHPHILPIFKVRIHEQGVSLISQHPLQGSLQARLNQRPFQALPLHEAGIIIKQVGQALHHAHQSQVFHGSLTPWAVFFHNANHAVVTSFHFPSIVAALPNYQPLQNQRLPQTWYMAPEQFDGVINEKTDQYALGCLAYVLLTGRVPLPGYTHRTLIRKHHSEAPKSLIAYNSQLPVHIEEAILKTLAKQPEQRYGSIQDFLQALEAPTPHFAPQVRLQPSAASGNLQTTVVQRFYSLPPIRTLSQNLAAGYYSKSPFHTLLTKGYQKNGVVKRPLVLGLIALAMVIVLAVITMSVAFAGQAHQAPSTP
ncbi:MAG TPA: protein kinase, partial [Ktedonobacteraceae bacterium]